MTAASPPRSSLSPLPPRSPRCAARPWCLALALVAGATLATLPRAALAGGGEAARRLLRQANDYYTRGAYQRAVDTLRTLVEAKVLEDRADRREALRIYGICLYLSGAKPAAARAFRDLLRRDKTVRLDPSFVRPEVVAFFERVRRKLARERAAFLAKHGPRGSAAVNLLPPWGQFRNGHRVKGWLLLGLEVALLATSAATYAVLVRNRRDDNTFPFSDDTYNALRVTNYASAAALAAVLLYGVIDGLVYYYRRPRFEDQKDTPAKVGVALSPGGLRLRF